MKEPVHVPLDPREIQLIHNLLWSASLRAEKFVRKNWNERDSGGSKEELEALFKRFEELL